MRAVFVGGSGRSGTTMTGAMLGAGPGSICVPEAHFKFDLEREVGDAGITGREATAFLERFWEYATWALDAPLDPGRRYASAAEVVEDLVRGLARRTGRPEPEVWVDHTPTNVDEGLVLADRYPGSTFVHVVRDGRAVAASVLPMDWGPNQVRHAAARWMADVAAGLALEDALPGRVARVAYEDLVTDPAETLKAVCARIGLSWDPRMPEGGRTDLPSYLLGTHPNIVEPPDPSRTDRWREILSARQVEAFEYHAQGVLASLGYPLVHGGGARRPWLAWSVARRLRGRAKKLLVDPFLRRRRKRRGIVRARGTGPR